MPQRTISSLTNREFSRPSIAMRSVLAKSHNAPSFVCTAPRWALVPLSLSVSPSLSPQILHLHLPLFLLLLSLTTLLVSRPPCRLSSSFSPIQRAHHISELPNAVHLRYPLLRPLLGYLHIIIEKIPAIPEATTR